MVELVVVLAIIVVITGMAITSQSSFNKTLILANTAYDVALTLRAAETYGLGSRAVGITADAGYGLHFNRATPSTFILFADTYPAPSTESVCHPTLDAAAPDAKPGDCAYGADQGELITSYTLGNGITINNFCAYALGSWSCAVGNGDSVATMDIVFARPNPEPFISVNGTYSATSKVTQACISLTSPQGGARFVSVAASGEITANTSSCP